RPVSRPKRRALPRPLPDAPSRLRPEGRLQPAAAPLCPLSGGTLPVHCGFISIILPARPTCVNAGAVFSHDCPKMLLHAENHMAQGELEGAKPASNQIKCTAKPCTARRAAREARTLRLYGSVNVMAFADCSILLVVLLSQSGAGHYHTPRTVALNSVHVLSVLFVVAVEVGEGQAEDVVQLAADVDAVFD